MDFSTLSNDDLANALKAAIDEVHARVDGVANARASRLLTLAHGAMDGVRSELVSAGTIHPDSGGGNKGTN